MNMTERMAQAIYETNPLAHWPPADDAEREYWLAAARAAERIVIEECAQVVDYRAAHWPDDACRELLILAAAAIRALKEKP